ncbi:MULTISPECIES: methylated-DNA--[protein]-cysteine S-methyltransferase [unclassified Paenibacillus]|uniref:methylated-DNA--[protein]-cysteine S-methyltransferase n=1 Tax=unclassified Paenibacillus TaxID=185978 RepID=UPI001C0FCA55|nr:MULTISPECIES: methylated-DNA--[protein]-cysteine S-methyltransferase [unclassified Paenibacillus]MBU5443225.1 methylated-DNA--[protein]-cysteine S-methyltransferase [Paenibacillus sp. MSJ-34]CAH0121375.1 Methylated-DNA--protein-cysteine methyltransferase, inducible [Paenibacillus sp. CECT 9249]
METQMIEWAVLEYDCWNLHAAVTEMGLCYVGSPGQTDEEMRIALRHRFPSAAFRRNDEALRPYMNELLEYFEGKRQSFTIPIDMRGTSFQEKVWEALKRIPYGHTCSYSDIARIVQSPKAVRAVGSAIAANPVLIAVPCHRVVGKNGAITGYRGGLDMKRYLLELEVGG